MKKVFLKNDKGSITIFVLLSCLFFLITVTSVGVYMTNKNHSVERKYEQIKLSYEKNVGKEKEVYDKIMSGASLPSTDDTTPYLPDDTFKILENDPDKGLVIADSQGNEWVWIEVPKSVTKDAATTAQIESALETYAAPYINGSAVQSNGGWKDEWYEGCGLEEEEYKALYNKMLNSIKTNGGFWIGKYEVGDSEATTSNTARTSNDVSHTPVIKANQIPYTFVTCSQAQILSKKFSEGKDYRISLLFGIQWDLVCKYLRVKATNPGSSANDMEAAINSNSTDWGNYINAIFNITKGKYSTDSGSTWNPVTGTYTKPSSMVLLTTGATERNSLMNIYDFAGNVWEWTGEHATSYPNYPCADRGGDYDHNGSYLPASNRNFNDTTNLYGTLGFRPALYK